MSNARPNQPEKHTLTLHSLDALLRGDITWGVTKEGLEIARNDRSWSNDIEDVGPTVIPADILNVLHPQLYGTLEELRKTMDARIRRNSDGDLYRDYSDGRYPRAVIRNLCAPFVVEDVVTKNQIFVACVWDISWSGSGNRVTLHTMSYDMPEVDEQEDKGALAIPARVSSQQARVSKEWMDAACPDWENRLHSGQALGLTKDTLVDYVFPMQEPVTPAASSSISRSVNKFQR